MGFRRVPSAGEQDVARNYLVDLMNRNIDAPQQEVAGLTEEQKAVQGDTENVIASTNRGYQEANNYLQEVLGGNYDPRTSDYYKGLRNEAETFKADSNAALKRRSQAGGMMYSTPAAGLQAENTRRIDDRTLRQLGGLYENERDRMGQAATGIGQVDAQQISNLGAGNQLLDQQRGIEQARLNAQYQEAMTELLAPYQYQAPLASPVLQEQRYFYKSNSGGGMMGGILGSAAGGLLGGIGGGLGESIGGALGF